MIHRVYAVGFGLYFGLAQTAYFFQMEILLTAAYTGFITATLAWIGGALAGLLMPRWLAGEESLARGLVAWHGAGLAAYYMALALLAFFPYDFSLLPVYCLLIMVSGAQAGHFFRANQKYFPSAASLFLMENNGFILGWLGGFAGFVAFGVGFNQVAPLALSAPLIPILLLYARACEASHTPETRP